MLKVDYEIPTGHILYAFGSDQDLVLTRFIPFLDKFTWQSFRMATGKTLILGKRAGLWYTQEQVFTQCNSKRNPKFKELKQLEIKMDKTSCWEWHGSHYAGTPVSNLRGRQMRIIQVIVDLVGWRWAVVTHSLCGNDNCGRPSHYRVRGGFDE